MDLNMFEEAKALIKNGTSIGSVAKKLDLEYQTLYNHIKGLNRSFSVGRPTLLPEDVELELITTATYLASRNLGLNLRRFKAFAKEIFKKLHPNLSEDKQPVFSLKWWKNFKERHPNFHGLRPKNTDILKQEMYSHKEIMKTFFDNYQELTAIYAFKPHQIWNADESGTKQQESHLYIMSQSQPNVGSQQSNVRCHTTLLPCINAIGQHAPPLFIFQGTSYGSEDLKFFNHGQAWATCTTSGFINEEIFLDWFKKFISWLNTTRNKSEKHLLLIDNLKAHCSYNILVTAKENNIELLALPANCTHIIQPLDINIFKIFKSRLRDKLPEELNRLMKTCLTNQEFVKLMSDIWSDTFNTLNIKRSFELIGICPFNPEIVYERMHNKTRTIQPHLIINQRNENRVKKVVDNNPITHVKSTKINSEILEEFDLVKKELINLQVQFTRLKSETVVKPQKNAIIKITPSRIMTSEEIIDNTKIAKQKKGGKKPKNLNQIKQTNTWDDFLKNLKN